MEILATADLVDWLAAAAVLGLLAGLVFLAWWALFADRPAGRRRCPRCWYELTWSTGMTCPECGFLGDRERVFRRTRRRPLIALLAILGCTALGLYLADRASMRGWTSYLPTRALIWALPLADPPRSPIVLALSRRIRNGELSAGQWLSLIGRCARGDRKASPPSDGWIAKYGPMLRASRGFAAGEAGPEEEPRARAKANLILLGLPPRVDLSTRRRWPAEVGPVIAVRARAWWPRGTGWRVRAEPKVPGGEVDVHVLRDAPIQVRSYSLRLPPLAEGEHLVEIALSCERREGAGAAWVPLHRERVTVPITVAGTLAEALAPVSGEAFDEAVRRTFRQGVVKHEGGSLPVRIGLDARETYRSRFDDTAVAVHVELLRNGEPARQLDIWWLGGTGRFDRQHAWEVPWLDEARLAAASRPDEEWILRIRGVRELALRVDGAARYWSGQVQVRVPMIPRPGPAPPRGWIEGTR